ncbi:phosphatase PAP2 family protein [Candidatus Woesearchaeota archaeon]|nr:phosphatase PAP2 family protein [Candidatus Woesearchaeota archaeon]
MRKNQILFGGALLLFIVAFLLDDAVVNLMPLIQNNYLTYIMVWFTHSWSTFFVLIFLTSLFLWTEKKKKWIPLLLISIFFGVFFSYLIKFIIARPRPLGFEKYFFSIKDYSFPSSHATISFAAVAVLDRVFCLLKWFWLCFALVVSFSRLYFNYHYLSDVVSGIFLGYFIGRTILIMVNKNAHLKRIFGN